MRISDHHLYGIMLHADTPQERLDLGNLVRNVKSHTFEAADFLEGSITTQWPNLERGVLTLIEDHEPICDCEIAGFKRNVPKPLPEPEPEQRWINGVEVEL